MSGKADLSSFPQFQGQRMTQQFGQQFSQQQVQQFSQQQVPQFSQQQVQQQPIMQQPQVVQSGYVSTLPTQYVQQQYVQQPTQIVEEYVEQPVVYQQQPAQQIHYVQQAPQVIREREIVEVPVDRMVAVDRVVERNVPVYIQQPPQIVDRVVETPPQFIETTRHTRDPSVRIRLELCPKCRKNPVNQRALQEIRLLSGAPPTQFHTTTQTLNPQPLGAPALYGAPAFAPAPMYAPAVRTAF